MTQSKPKLCHLPPILPLTYIWWDTGQVSKTLHTNTVAPTKETFIT